MSLANATTLPLAGFTPRHFQLAVAGKVATVTLNRPEKKNPLTFESYRELTDFFLAAQKEEAVKAIASDLDPPDDIQETGAVKKHLAGVLLRRVAAQLTGARA